MLYLVDGHNLIPKLGLSLQSMDDEDELIRLLLEFCRLRRASVEVFFDGAPPGHLPSRTLGTVTARFVRQGTPADAAIESRLSRLGRQARGCAVVSSDRRVLQAAHAAHARALTSEEFALEVSKAQASASAKFKGEATLAPEEVEEWLDEFSRKRGQQR